MTKQVEVVCTNCGRGREDALAWRCGCGGPYTIQNESSFDRKLVVRGDRSIWRYRNFMPIDHRAAVSLGEGSTPLVALRNGAERVDLKCEYMLPTASFKDRGSTLAVSNARAICEKHGIKQVAEDSSGNAGVSMAAYCSRAGLECAVYVPERVSPVKAQLIEGFGAKLVRVAGSREDVSRAASRGHPSRLYLGHVYDPFFVAGIETLAFEIVEDLAWAAPAVVVCPISAGTLLLGVLYGFERLVSSGVIDRVPKLVAVQTERVSPIYSAFHGRAYTQPERIETVADALVSTNPPRLNEIVQVLKRNAGIVEVVAEEEIIVAYRELARRGFFVEPSSAVAYAGFQKFRRSQAAFGRVAIVLTGAGLKTPPP